MQVYNGSKLKMTKAGDPPFTKKLAEKKNKSSCAGFKEIVQIPSEWVDVRKESGRIATKRRNGPLIRVRKTNGTKLGLKRGTPARICQTLARL